MNHFYKGFTKVADMLSKMDSQGGVAPREEEEIAAAQAVDLLTLPKTIEGAACANCRFMKVFDKKTGSGMCQNPAVMQEVTERMHCNQWDGQGALRNWDAPDKADEIPPPMGQAAQIGPDGMPLEPAIDPMTGQPMDPNAAPAAEAGGADKAAPGGEKKPAAKKKPEAKGGHEININVGGKQMDKKAFMQGFEKKALGPAPMVAAASSPSNPGGGGGPRIMAKAPSAPPPKFDNQISNTFKMMAAQRMAKVQAKEKK